MNRWQYAWLTDMPATSIGFSHPQPGLAMELAGVLGPGVVVQQSTEWSVVLDRMRVNLGYVSGLLGDRGWEMFAVETRLQPGAMSPAQLQTNWYFKRPMPDGSWAAQAQASTPAVAPAPAPVPAPPVMPAAPAPPVMPAAPAAPAVPAVPAVPDQGGVGFASITPQSPAGPEPAGPSGFPPPPGPTGT